MVPQVFLQEPAIRHAALAMSALYENHKAKREVLASEKEFAIKHYNAALQQIAASQPASLDVVVIASMQFICIEFLRGNPSGAMVHYQYGQNLVMTYKANPTLLEFFRRLNFFIFFFSNFTGSSQSEYECPPASGPFGNIDQAQEVLGWLTYRVMKMAFGLTQRPHDPYHPDFPSSASSPWQLLKKDHEDWLIAVGHLRTKDPLLAQSDDYKLIEARWVACKIMIQNQLPNRDLLDKEDMVRRIVEIACNVTGGRPEPVSPFGFPALLFFVIMQSKSLELRLVALNIFKDNCLQVAMLWDANMLYQSAKAAIEEDHSIILNPELKPAETCGRPVPIKTPGQILETQQALCSWVVVVMDACSDIRKPAIALE